MNTLNSKADTHFVGSYRFKQKNWPVFINTQMNETGTGSCCYMHVIEVVDPTYSLWETTICSFLTYAYGKIIYVGFFLVFLDHYLL